MLRMFGVLAGTLAASALAQGQTTADYPPDALQLRHEGKVKYEITVGTDGRAHNCRIIQSSGYEELDRATCKIILARAKFRPAKDENGNLIEDRWTSVVTWILPH